MEVMQGERIAISGSNGCGKSSIIKLIAGESVPHAGEVRLASGLAVSYVPQDTEFLSGSLAAFAERANIERTVFMTILRNLGFERHDLNSDLASLSEGQKKKILLARSVATPAHLYLWDEPFNFIDVISRVQLEALIREYEPTMVFVEHDAMFAERVATRVLGIGGSKHFP
jgi:lincosamide and streptogramin A transport system ATP-binding/permease protein